MQSLFTYTPISWAILIVFIATTTTTILWPFVRDHQGEPVPEETFTHSPILIIIQPYQLQSIYRNCSINAHLWKHSRIWQFSPISSWAVKYRLLDHSHVATRLCTRCPVPQDIALRHRVTFFRNIAWILHNNQYGNTTQLASTWVISRQRQLVDQGRLGPVGNFYWSASVPQFPFSL